MKNDILLSIICPAYNAEKTIGKLIESIVQQDFKNYEFIILNDGSKDKTFEVIERYAKKYKNIVAVDKPNTGVGDTRNEGLKIAKGKYITFADADDWYSEDFFEKIIPEIEKNNFELLVFNAKVMNYEEYMHNLIPKKYKEGLFIEKEGVRKYLLGEFCHKIGNVPWNKIYLNKIIKDNNLKYEENKKRGEDLLFNVLYVSKIEKYRYVNLKLYYYALNMNTMTTNIYRKNSIEENIKYYDYLKKICIDSKIENYYQYIGLFFLRRFPGIVLNETNNQNFDIGKDNIKNYLNNEKLENIYKKIKFKNMDLKLMMSFFFYKLKLYKLVYRVLWNVRHYNAN